MTKEEFEKLVGEALDGLPPEFGEKLSNVAVTVTDWPTREDLLAGNTPPGMTLFGLYQGVPQTKRTQYSGALPDKITIFAGPIITAVGDNTKMVRKQVQKTLLHEIGHHFGMSEEEIHNRNL